MEGGGLLRDVVRVAFVRDARRWDCLSSGGGSLGDRGKSAGTGSPRRRASAS